MIDHKYGIQNNGVISSGSLNKILVIGLHDFMFKPTLWLHDLWLEFLIVHGNELRPLFWPRHTPYFDLYCHAPGITNKSIKEECKFKLKKLLIFVTNEALNLIVENLPVWKYTMYSIHYKYIIHLNKCIKCI